MNMVRKKKKKAKGNLATSIYLPKFYGWVLKRMKKEEKIKSVAGGIRLALKSFFEEEGRYIQSHFGDKTKIPKGYDELRIDISKDFIKLMDQLVEGLNIYTSRSEIFRTAIRQFIGESYIDAGLNKYELNELIGRHN